MKTIIAKLSLITLIFTGLSACSSDPAPEETLIIEK